MIGTTFGRYVIESKIGEGGMGVVYRGRDIKLQRLVALKLLNRRMLASPTAYGWLLREAQIASSLNHPAICTIYDVGEEEDQPYIAMEYIQGQPLSALVKPTGIPAGAVCRYGCRIADALGHAHERGVIHRDIKSSNMLISDGGSLKVLDFGLAKRLRGQSIERITTSRSSLAEIGALAGTLPYQAPEILRGERADVRSDLWSLGVVLFEMATGTPPFCGHTVFELSAKIMIDEPAAFPRGVPGYLAQVIKRCLHKNPVSRYACARDVAKGLGMRCQSVSLFGTANLETAGRPKAFAVGGAAN